MSTGVLTSRPIYPTSSGLNPELDSRAFAFFPFTVGAMATSEKSGTRTFVEPAPPHFARTGKIATGFGADWFYRIHITPATINLGNLVSSLSETVRVWNAWLNTTQQLNTITAANNSGITLTPPSPLPITFTPNAELAFTATISLEGSPTINATYTFGFADSETPALNILGQRITAWGLTPNWQTPVSERLEFKTGVMHAWSGAEMRQALRIAPRRIFEFDVLMTSRDRRYIEAQLFAWSARLWALPIWPDGQLLAAAVSSGATSIACDTVNRDFVVGGLAIMITNASTFEVVQVLTVASGSIGLVNPVQNNWQAGTKLYPVRAAVLSGFPKLGRGSADVAVARVAFQITDACDWPAATGLPTYRGFNVFENSPSDGALEATYNRDVFTIDNETGVIELLDPPNAGMPTHSHDWFMQGRSARAALRGLLYLLKGMQGEIWIPTYQADIKLAAAVTSVQTTLDVEMTGYTLYLQGQINRQDIRIELLSGAIYYRRVTGAIVLDANTERLSLDSGLGINIATTDVRRISYMALGRLGSDSIQIDHFTADDGLATARTPWKALNRNV